MRCVALRHRAVQCGAASGVNEPSLDAVSQKAYLSTLELRNALTTLIICMYCMKYGILTSLVYKLKLIYVPTLPREAKNMQQPYTASKNCVKLYKTSHVYKRSRLAILFFKAEHH